MTVRAQIPEVIRTIVIPPPVDVVNLQVQWLIQPDRTHATPRTGLRPSDLLKCTPQPEPMFGSRERIAEH
jgi:hypothetical protein